MSPDLARGAGGGRDPRHGRAPPWRDARWPRRAAAGRAPHAYGGGSTTRSLRKRGLMATTRNATTTWEGTLFEGAGRVELQSSGIGTFDVSWPARAEEPGGKTSPEELIAAAHSSCFSMALSNGLTKAGTPPERLETTGRGHLPARRGHHRASTSPCAARCPGISADDFVAAAEAAKTGCPVSQALTGTTITLDASLA